ncbi:hypothetical protein GDO78_000003 [Eleutherodactylus coqui]|uniref:Uncharacterized protein n=1 Tax=Eleutherodactylus coqui TaxID=57060 RepID=A0A8J6FR88_ELECQ|nr:hypothetical protein GDO78_000003 [Eleutherodactylus coqui]
MVIFSVPVLGGRSVLYAFIRCTVSALATLYFFMQISYLKWISKLLKNWRGQAIKKKCKQVILLTPIPCCWSLCTWALC